MAKSLINDFLKKHQEECIKEVQQMQQHPYSLAQMKAQVEMLHSQSQKGMRETKDNNSSRKG